ncbi:MAG: DNA cytosine methyltransferase [Defluviitaleaceae bacterium]|nr:DNA cytosine methyltransferase [Defluviitaleaceae bacterium]
MVDKTQNPTKLAFFAIFWYNNPNLKGGFYLFQQTLFEQTPEQTPNTNVWDKTTPIEKSAYTHETAPTFCNTNNLTIPPNALTMLDLFCGAGGFSVGCGWAGFFPVFGLDYLAPAVATWSKNHPNSIACLGDISLAEPQKIKEMLSSKGVEHIHLITGGVPCQGFSIANRKHHDYDKRNFLFLEYMKFVKAFQPNCIILENVSGMRSTAKGEFEKEIKCHMEELGYTVTVDMVNAAKYGVPQVRHRLIFVGVRKSLGCVYKIPMGKFETSENYRTVADALSDLPKLKNNEQVAEYANPPKTEFQALMRGFGDLAIQKTDKLHNHAAPNHPPETIQKIANTAPGQPMYPKFKQRIRLSLDQPSPTQLAGGIRPQFQFGHPTQPRGLSIRERARIQSFPDSYEFVGGIVQERVLTGNAVPPLMIYELVKPIAKMLKEREKNV